MDEPHWEHGKRCHGYWLGLTRWGFVGLAPRGQGGVKANGYGWEFMPNGIVRNDPLPEHRGRTTTLRAAKRVVELCYRQFLQQS